MRLRRRPEERRVEMRWERVVGDCDARPVVGRRLAMRM